MYRSFSALRWIRWLPRPILPREKVGQRFQTLLLAAFVLVPAFLVHFLFFLAVAGHELGFGRLEDDLKGSWTRGGGNVMWLAYIYWCPSRNQVAKSSPPPPPLHLIVSGNQKPHPSSGCGVPGSKGSSHLRLQSILRPGPGAESKECTRAQACGKGYFICVAWNLL